MRKILASLALFAVLALGLSQMAALPPANDVTRFPGAVYAYKYVTGTFVQGRDSVGSRLGSFGRVRTDTINGYVQGTYQILDTALTGYATLPTDTLRLTCGINVSGYFVAGITGTSNGAALTIGHIPAACRPSHTVQITLQQVTNNSVTRIGFGSVATTGIITVSKTDTVGVQSATFTSSGTKGVGAGVSFSFSRF